MYFSVYCFCRLRCDNEVGSFVCAFRHCPHQPFNSMNNTPGRALRQGAEPRRAHHTTASLLQPTISSKPLLNLTILLTYNNSLISLFIFFNSYHPLRCAVVKLSLRCAPLRTCDGCISVAQYSMNTCVSTKNYLYLIYSYYSLLIHITFYS